MSKHPNLLRLLLVFLAAALFWLFPLQAAGTSSDRSSLCNLEGNPGDLLQEKITLSGTEAALRKGVWEIYYKPGEADNERMDISSWLSVEPRDFTLAQDEKQVFTLKVQIPGRAYAGIWGAATAEAGLSGHAAERRTYVLFRDTQDEGNLYTGMMIPVSVRVMGTASPFAAFFRFISENAMVFFLVVVIMALLIVMLVMFKSRRS